jgi:hypothetical protein
MRGLLLKRIATVTVLFAVCLSATVALAAAPAAPSAPSAGSVAAGLDPGNSRPNSALLEARNIAPGDSRSSTVTITNRDRVPGSFTLSKYGLREAPGRGGGKLSLRLTLRVQEVTPERSAETVYAGPVGSMSRQSLGTFTPGESRTYRFTVTFADGGESPGAGLDDNAYMGASLSVGFRWRGSQ